MRRCRAVQQLVLVVRSHVLIGATTRVGANALSLGAVAKLLGKAKVTDLREALVVDQNVLEPVVVAETNRV